MENVIKKNIKKNKIKIINQFKDKYFFLSNFYPCNIIYKDKIYPSSEHLYQALKTKNKDHRCMIKNARTCGEAKRLGSRVTLREDWEEVKIEKMYKVLTLKFSQNPDLAKKLLKTKDTYLIEGNYWHDNFWGICICLTCKTIKPKIYKDGNQLGQLLMHLRTELYK